MFHIVAKLAKRLQILLLFLKYKKIMCKGVGY